LHQREQVYRECRNMLVHISVLVKLLSRKSRTIDVLQLVNVPYLRISVDYKLINNR
jgi:hypothetical protein